MSLVGFRRRGGVSWRPSGRRGLFMVNEKQDEKDELNCDQNMTNSGTEEWENVLG